jgi:DsbC/DsbD-like thiol-disulfide interchange protein
LRLRANFGVCREICVPLEASHELTVAPGVTGEADGALRDALAHVPKPMSGDNSGLPTVSRAEVSSYDAPAGIVITASFPDGAAGADIFIEAPEGLYVPMPKRGADSNDGTVTFTSSFSSPAELKSILGKPLKVTLVGNGTASEAIVTIE